jgi:hypothetical protein
VVLGGCTAVTLSEQFHHHEGRALRGEGTTVSFDQLGHENTADTLRLARARAEQVGIRDIVVASSTGTTGVKACERFPGYNVVVVAGAVGRAFQSGGHRAARPDIRRRRMPGPLLEPADDKRETKPKKVPDTFYAPSA